MSDEAKAQQRRAERAERKIQKLEKRIDILTAACVGMEFVLEIVRKETGCLEGRPDLSRAVDMALAKRRRVR